LTLGGNAFDNSIVGGDGNDAFNGGDGNDRLDGGNGADRMTGGAGNDVYYIDNIGDQAIDSVGGGTDRIYASISYILAAGQEIEGLLASSGTIGITLDGNAFDNSIVGGAGNDTLNGGNGNDKLIGGAGNDIFLFDSQFIGVRNVDTISDFDVTKDIIQLDHTCFPGLAFSQLSAAAFAVGSASGTAPQIVYDISTGSLSYDNNGADAGGRSQFARLINTLSIQATNFLVV